MHVYADNAATTRMHQTAIDTMTYHLNHTFGNPSSLYTIGQEAKEVLETARADMAACFGAQPREIYFTSGGSEADNQAITSAAYIGARKGKKHIISTTFEHHAVLHTLKRLEKQGFEVTLLDVHADGLVTAQQVADAIRDDTCLVTIMFANNEIGTIQPIREIGAVCHERGVLFHTDAVQAAGHVKIDVNEMNIDMLSLSAHKFHGPKGVGMLYARRGIILTNLIEGGAQERSLRAGTENVPAIVGMGRAIELITAEMAEENARISGLRDRLIAGILDAIPESRLNGHPTKRLPGNVNVSIRYIEGEALLLSLDMAGIAASSGSACTSGSLDPSHVLLAIGLPHEIAHGSLRLTIGRDNTQDEIDRVLEELPKIVSRLRAMSPLYDDRTL